MNEREKEAILIALETSYGLIKVNGSYRWESNDSGLSDDELTQLWKRIGGNHDL